jgi:hypothetical protein
MSNGKEGQQDAFSASLDRRRQAAEKLERDLLTEVPLLYGSPGGAQGGDPGIALAQIHRDELLRRNGGGLPPYVGKRSDVARLPFERTMAVVVIAVFLLLFALD